MPAQALILLATTPRKRKSATSSRLCEHSIDDAKSARQRSTKRGLHSVPFHTRCNDRGVAFVASETHSALEEGPRSGVINSYTTTLSYKSR
jgi:hypothetical protein